MDSAEAKQRNGRRLRLAALVVLLAVATTAGTYLQGALSVLSAEVIDEFGISRSQLGVFFTIFSVTGGLSSPLLGSLTDLRVRRMLAGLFVVATAGLLLTAAAPSFGWVLVGGVIGGLALGAGNPATNKIVSEQVSMRRRGLAIGVKQAGPPLGLLLSGVLLPPLASAFGWRWALAVTAVFPIAGILATRRLVPADRPRSPARVVGGGRAREVRSGRLTLGYLAGIGMLVAMGGSGIIAFLPLYAREDVGMSAVMAGLVAAVMGVTGVVARVLWGIYANRFRHASAPLAALSVAAFMSSFALWAGSGAPWLLWLGAFGSGASMLAWHAVAWLALLSAVEADGVGRATGLVQLGNSVGFGSGPPLVGLLVDSFSYAWGWAFVAACFGLATILTLLWRRVAA